MDVPPVFVTVSEYVRAVSDLPRWGRWASEALARSGLPAPERFTIGDVGTFPTLIGSNGLVVKFYADFCDGLTQHAVELAAYRILADAPLPAPRLVASGVLTAQREAWRWPYLIITAAPGVAYSAARLGLTAGRKRAIAVQLGTLLSGLHRTPLPPDGPLRADFGRFVAMLARRRSEVLANPGDWGGLRGSLGDALDEFLPRPEELLAGEPAFVHTDVHAQHVFVDPQRGTVTGLIDFADAFAADPHYELVTLHLCTFEADKTLLAAFLAGYSWPARPLDWPRRMLAWTMLHEWDILGRVIPSLIAPDAIQGLDHLAALLWDTTVP